MKVKDVVPDRETQVKLFLRENKGSLFTRLSLSKSLDMSIKEVEYVLVKLQIPRIRAIASDEQSEKGRERYHYGLKESIEAAKKIINGEKR